MTFADIMKSIAERFAELVMLLLGLPVRAAGYVAASAYEGWRIATTPEETHVARADHDDDETRRLLAETARLNAIAAATEARPARRRVCGSRDDPESGAPAAPAPPPSRTRGVVPTPRDGHRFVLLEMPRDDEAEELGLDAMLPVLR